MVCRFDYLTASRQTTTSSRLKFHVLLIWVRCAVCRITCLILIGLAALGIVYVSYLLHMRFAKRGLATVVESTAYPIYNIPYPAVMVCNNNRINWQRVPMAIERSVCSCFVFCAAVRIITVPRTPNAQIPAERQRVRIR